MKNNDLELKIYEMFGVKLFRKFVFSIYNALDFLRFRGLDEDTKKMIKHYTSNNYVMGKSDNVLADLKKYKKHIKNNATIHIFGLMACLPLILKAIFIGTTLSSLIITVIIALINAYCIMLQRYNDIKLNRTIKKYELREMKRKKALQYELIKSKGKSNRQVKIIANDRDDNQTMITFEEFLQLASVKQLKEYRDFLHNPDNSKSSYFLICVKNTDNLGINKNIKK